MIAALIPIIGNILSKILPDPQAAADAKLKLLDLATRGELAYLDAETKLALGQLEVNKAEAQSGNMFNSGWRPFVGWTCAGGLFYQIIFRPIFGWIAQNVAMWEMPPGLEMETLMTLLFGMLGLGGFRMAEKMKGVARN